MLQLFNRGEECRRFHILRRSFHVLSGSFHVLRGGFHVFGIHRKLRWRCDASIGQRYKEKRAVGVKYRLLRTLGVGGHNAVNAAAAPLHVVQAGKYIYV